MPNKRGAGKCTCCGNPECPSQGNCLCGADDAPIGCWMITLSGVGEPSLTCQAGGAITCDSFFNDYGVYVIGCGCTVNGNTDENLYCCEISDELAIGQVYKFFRVEFRDQPTTTTTLIRLAIGTTLTCYNCLDDIEGSTVPCYVKMRVLIWSFDNQVIDGCTKRKCEPELISDETCCGYYDTPVQAGVPKSQPEFPVNGSQENVEIGCTTDIAQWREWSCPWTVWSDGTAVDCADANCFGLNIGDVECDLDNLVVSIEYVTDANMSGPNLTGEPCP